MPIRSVLETSITGPFYDLKNYGLFVILSTVFKFYLIIWIIIIHGICQIKILTINTLVNKDPFSCILLKKLAIFNHIPIFGEILSKFVTKQICIINEQIIPGMKKFKMVLEHTFRLRLINHFLINKNIKFIFSGDILQFKNENNNEPLTTLCMTNHRSMIDYLVVNYISLVSQNKSVIKKVSNTSQDISQAIRFITWSRITNFPGIKLLINIFMKDENASISIDQLKTHLTEKGNSILFIFPEVNIFNRELKIIQSKLLKARYQDSPEFKNVLYPRFKNFIKTIDALAFFKGIKRSSSLKESMSNHINKWLSLKEYNNDNFENLKKAMDSTSMIKINENMYDLTIVYYQPILSKDEPNHKHGHNHLLNIPNLHYQMQQITPTYWQLFNIKRIQLPIIIRIHVKRHNLIPLLHMKSRQLERWLECRWCEKDEEINQMTADVKLM